MLGALFGYTLSGLSFLLTDIKKEQGTPCGKLLWLFEISIVANFRQNGSSRTKPVPGIDIAMAKSFLRY